jgi:membrane protein DedA with SNARE-associated domain
VAGYLLEAATLLPLFRMTMADGARPTWPESWCIVAALVVAAAGLHWLGQHAGRSVPAAQWKLTDSPPHE